MTALFDAFWAAVDGQALNVLERGSAPIMAFVNAHMETLVLIAGRLQQRQLLALPPHKGPSTAAPMLELAIDVVKAQTGLIWEHFFTRKLPVRATSFGAGLGRMLLRLQAIEPGAFNKSYPGSYPFLMLLFIQVSSILHGTRLQRQWKQFTASPSPSQKLYMSSFLPFSNPSIFSFHQLPVDQILSLYSVG